MTEYARLLQALYNELTVKGFDANPQCYIQCVNENLQELHRLIGWRQASRFQLAVYAEAGYWLYRIKELAEKLKLQ
ncbi:hypothetical protein ACFQZX_17645 [Mucilaginibacter litoreus]|uniref:Uncharacterized protein n=1 Tax=Mucilaginibacter litoreus TaxID=1048221 RepID=A0ABW3AX55_9SPHI